MPMRCYFLTCQVTIKFWPVYKSRLIFWTDFEDLKGRLIHRKIRYIPDWYVRQISLFLHLVCIAPRHKHHTDVKHLAAHAQHKCNNNSNKC